MNLAKFIDHTLLKPDATRLQIESLCAEAVAMGFHSVCVNSSWVAAAAEKLRGSGVRVTSVTGFPLGAMDSRAKARETELAILSGATEIDTVLAIGALKDRDSKAVLADLRGVIEAAQGAIVKVIFETCLLNEEEKILACELSIEAGAQFVKTSTGFSTGGATMDDVKLMHRISAGRCKVKASGGIRDRATALAMIDAGAERLGTSSGIAIVQGGSGQEGY